MNLSWHNAGQVRLWSRLTYFYMSYCPLQKCRFPDFSLSSFDILTWHLSWHNTGQVLILSCWPTFTWVIALCKNLVFRTFFSCLGILTWHFGIWICLDKFDFYCVLPDCTPKIFFCLNFRTFLCHLARYWHQIWGIDLYWHNTENFSLLYPFMYSFRSYASLKFVGAGRGHVLLQQYLQYACCLYKQCSGDFMFVTQAISYGLVFAYYTPWNSHCWSLFNYRSILLTSDFLIFKVDLFWGKIFLRILFTQKIAKN